MRDISNIVYNNTSRSANIADFVFKGVIPDNDITCELTIRSFLQHVNGIFNVLSEERQTSIYNLYNKITN
jgi:hypothetical protein